MAGEMMLWRAWVTLPGDGRRATIRQGEEFIAAADDPRCRSGRARLIGPAVAPAEVPAPEVAEALAAVAGDTPQKAAPGPQPGSGGDPRGDTPAAAPRARSGAGAAKRPARARRAPSSSG